MSIQDLPDELLLRIFKPFTVIQKYDDPFINADIPNAQTSENTKSLARFSKVCVKWHNIIEPILYSTFTKPNNSFTRNLAWNSFERPRDYTYVSKPNRSLRLFLRTIIERPHLAQSITRLCLGSWDETIYSEQYHHPYLEIVASEPDPDLRQAYQEALGRLEELTDSLTRRRARISSTRGYSGSKSCILGGDEGSELALLLLLAPNLDTLHLAQMPIMEDWMFVRLPGILPAVSHVKKIRLGSVGKVLDFAEDRLRWLMTLPSLQALTVFNCWVYGTRCSVPRPSQLTSLEFRSC